MLLLRVQVQKGVRTKNKIYDHVILKVNNEKIVYKCLKIHQLKCIINTLIYIYKYK